MPLVAAVASDPAPAVETPLTEPVLRFDEVEIPSPATVQEVHGEVELYTRTGWVLVTQKATLGNNSRLRIPAGASLRLAFSPMGSAQFQPAPKERLVALRIRRDAAPTSN